MAKTNMKDLIESIEAKVDINKRQDDFFKVERVEIIESRISVVETRLTAVEAGFDGLRAAIMPVLEKLLQILEAIEPIPEVIVEDLPSESLVPPLPEILPLPEPSPPDFVPPAPEPEIIHQEIEGDLYEFPTEPEPEVKGLEADIIIIDEVDELDLSLIEANPKPAGEFTVGFDPAIAADPNCDDCSRESCVLDGDFRRRCKKEGFLYFNPKALFPDKKYINDTTYSKQTELAELEAKIAAIKAKLGDNNDRKPE